MPKNKLLQASIILYSFTTLLFILYLIGLTSKVFFNKTPNLPFLLFPDAFLYLLVVPIILILVSIIYGLKRGKKWAYKLGVFFGLMTFINFLISLSEGDPNWLNVLAFVPAIPLYLARKEIN